MKTIAFCLSCMLGAIIAYHDTQTFMSPTVWVIVAVIGLLLLAVPALIMELPTCPLTNVFTSTSLFIMCVGATMAINVFLVSNCKLAGTICAFFVFVYAVISRFLYSIANNSDKHEQQDEEWAQRATEEKRYPK